MRERCALLTGAVITVLACGFMFASIFAQSPATQLVRAAPEPLQSAKEVTNGELRVPLPDGAEIISRVRGSKATGKDYVWQFRSRLKWSEVLGFFSVALRQRRWDNHPLLGAGCWRRDGRNDYEDIVCVSQAKSAGIYELRMSPPAPE
jgi:hypothetical protein